MSGGRYFAPCAPGLEKLVASELRRIGVTQPRPRTAGTAFSGKLVLAYRAILESRFASRVLVPVGSAAGSTRDALHAALCELPWEDHIPPGGTLAVDFAGTNSVVRHTRFGAQLTKDAVVDRIRDRTGRRPAVDLERPDVRINVHLGGEGAIASIDLSGRGLHRRGYRPAEAPAPLRETLAAAILELCGWPERAAEGGTLLDPMCGSGTLLIEGALMAGQIAPGLLVRQRGSPGWLGHDHSLWDRLRAQAEATAEEGRRRMPKIVGYDRDPEMIRIARTAVERAGLADHVTLETRDIRDLEAPPGPPGLVVTNPPYGHRLKPEQLSALYGTLGERLMAQCPGWRAGVFIGDPQRERDLRFQVDGRHRLKNGSLRCVLLTAALPETGSGDEPGSPGAPEVSTDAASLRNRLKKNQKRLKSWRKSAKVTCYRLYDADIPEYAAAIDVYDGHAHVQEYEAPLKVPTPVMEQRRAEMLAITAEVLDIPAAQVHHKVRRRQRGGTQYEREEGEGIPFLVEEGGHRFWVNLDDRLDTGLFLDDRNLRQRIAKLAPGKRFLNLFAYTGAASVYAIRAGAKATTTVDMSRTYLDWADRNFEANGIDDPAHELVRADCLRWLAAHDATPCYDLVFLAPPSYSRSKGMEGDFDIQRDHVTLLQDTLRWLAPGGTLLFTTNLRSFQLDTGALAAFEVEEITESTIPQDFRRGPPIHRAFMVRAP